MITLNQLIYNIRNIIKDTKSDDIKISDRQLEYIINYVRAKLIKQEIDKGKPISANIIQDLGIVQIQKVDMSGSNTVKSATYTMKTVRDIPKPIELNQRDAITYVGGIDRVSPYQFTTKAQAHWYKYNKYTCSKRFAYLDDSKIVVTDQSGLSKYISVEGVFENPRLAFEFSGNTYNPDTDNYPISSYMIQPLTELIVSKELSLFYKLPDDIRNDASEQVRV